jgi:hypothetical protein
MVGVPAWRFLESMHDFFVGTATTTANTYTAKLEYNENKYNEFKAITNLF